MSLYNFSIKRPISLLMIYFAGMIFGIISLQKMEIDLLPPVQYPEISVITLYAGASPKEIETLVTRPIEEAVSSVSGVKRVKSESIEGASLVTAQFDWGADIDYAATRVREKVDMVKGFLPEDTEKSIVARFDPNSLPIMDISASSSLDAGKLRRLVEKKIKPKLERINGVGSARITGGKIREILVYADLPALYAHGLSIYDIIEKIYLSNYNFPAGNVIKGKMEYLVRTIGEFTSLNDIRNVIVKRNEDGKVIYVKDVAEVKDGYRDRTSISYSNGKESINLSIIKEAGRNTVKVCEKIKELITDLNRKYKNVITLSINYDGSGYIRSAVNSVTGSAVIGGLIAFFVILIFLKKLKDSLIIASVFPASILITLLIMFMKGITLNMMSLGGLALGIGMLVDSGIVVTESIRKSINFGLKINEACAKGVIEVMAPLFASTLTSIVVFLPIIFLSGIAGEVFSELAFTVSISLIISYLVSITLVPALFVLFFKGTAPHNKRIDYYKSKNRQFLFTSIKPLKLNSLKNSILKKSEIFYRILNFIEEYYIKLLSKNLTSFKRALLAGVVSIVIGIVFFIFIDTGFMPETDNGSFIIRIAAEKGTPLDKTAQIMLDIDKTVSAIKDVKHRTIKAGFNPEDISEYFGREKSRSTAEMLVTLRKDRNIETAKVIKKLKEMISLPNSVKLEIFTDDREFSGISNMISSSLTIDIFGNDFSNIDKSVSIIADKLKISKKFSSIVPLIEKGKPEVKINIDRGKLASFGLNLRDAADHIRASIHGENAGKFYEADNEIDITVRLRERDRQDISNIDDILVKTEKDRNIPLKAFAGAVVKTGYSRITRKDQQRYFSIKCESSENDNNALININRILDNINLPGDTSASISNEFIETRESIRRLTFSLLLSILLIYMILASQFESFTRPLIIMLSVPLTISGISASLMLTGNSVNIVSVMGMVMLSGIVVNNAIVLLERIRFYQDMNLDPAESIIKGCRERLRPILMTTLTTMLGLFPLALGLQEGGEIQAPQGITVIGGLLVSTLLTLLLIPVYYYRFEVSRSVSNKNINSPTE